jgi:hypothetical protein
MDMIVAGDPFIAAGKRREIERDLSFLGSAQLEFLHCGCIKRASISFDTILARGQIEGGLAVEQQEMRLIVSGNFERRGRGYAPPQHIAVKRIDAKSEQALHRIEAEWSVVLKQVNARRDGAASFDVPRNQFDLGSEGRAQRLPHLGDRQHHAANQHCVDSSHQALNGVVVPILDQHPG